MPPKNVVLYLLFKRVIMGSYSIVQISIFALYNEMYNCGQCSKPPKVDDCIASC